MREKMQAMVREAQDAICAGVESLDRDNFREDEWTRPEGGGGWSRVLQDGSVFEKAGVNVSVVHGVLPPQALQSMLGGKLNPDDYPTEEDRRFFATGVSVVIHPHNPFAPTAHCNYRYFEMGDGSTWWFGGGADLTPSYLFEDDARHFHQVHKDACDKHDPEYYARFKKECDDYFVIKHRGERRGVGGIFFDALNHTDPDTIFAFSRECAMSFAPSYVPLVERHMSDVFNEQHKEWQGLRRGRYVEFNLVYDRGTTFGLRTGGRVESILMSLPLTARWEYDNQPEPGTPEHDTVTVLKEPRDWL